MFATHEPLALLTFKPTINKLWREIQEGSLSPRRTHELLDALMNLAIRINQHYAEAAHPAAAHPDHHLYQRSARMIEELTDLCFAAMIQADTIPLRAFMQKHLGDLIDH
ncbi:MAG: hypothetical protein L6Q40_13065 [Azonexus sp.]|nr:hypothetical protein [Azonexus sp.]